MWHTHIKPIHSMWHAPIKPRRILACGDIERERTVYMVPWGRLFIMPARGEGECHLNPHFHFKTHIIFINLRLFIMPARGENTLLLLSYYHCYYYNCYYYTIFVVTIIVVTIILSLLLLPLLLLSYYHCCYYVYGVWGTWDWSHTYIAYTISTYCTMYHTPNTKHTYIYTVHLNINTYITCIPTR
jgi:hypothetical protein